MYVPGLSYDSEFFRKPRTSGKINKNDPLVKYVLLSQQVLKHFKAV
jgi:hypothetical protein